MKNSILFLTLLALLGCTKENDNLTKEYKANSARWKSKINGNYTFTQTRNCFCINGGQKMTVKVQNNKIVDVKDTNGASLSADMQQYYKTIDDLFDLIRTTNPDSVAAINVTYDTTLGYPKSVYIDKDERMADEEIGYTSENVSY